MAGKSSYVLFFSFRLADISHNFLQDLQKNLRDRDILAFLDDVELENDEIVNCRILEAIEESKIAVVVLSPNYANSPWALRILEHILECRLIVHPIFYYVTPSDVYNQERDFGAGFQTACSGQAINRVNKWTEVLKQVARVKGYVFPQAYTLVSDLTNEIIQEINAGGANEDGESSQTSRGKYTLTMRIDKNPS